MMMIITIIIQDLGIIMQNGYYNAKCNNLYSNVQQKNNRLRNLNY